MYILGIDPGTGRTGWGVIKHENSIVSYVAHGCVVTSQDFSMQERLLSLHKELAQIIEKYQPECMVVEQIFFGMNVKTAVSVSQARGVIMLSCAQKNLAFHEYTSISVKYLLGGNGRTEKKDIQQIVRRILSKNSTTLSFSTKDKAFDDAADALAIAIHHTWKLDGKAAPVIKLEPKKKSAKSIEKAAVKKLKADAKKAKKKKSGV